MANVSMRLSATVVLAACGGVCGAARAQEFLAYTMTWSEVLAGTSTPVATPNGVLQPGEAVRIALKVTVMPGIGATTTYTPPPPPGIGTIAGLGSIFIDILGTNLNGGTWSNITRNAAANPGGTPGGHNWTLGGGGTGQPNGDITAIGAGQFVLPGNTAVSDNPITNIWRGTWTPSSYTIRALTFTPAGAQASAGDHSSILVQHGVDANGNPQYVAKFVPGSFTPLQIPIPAPGVAGVVGGAVMAAMRRRRRSSTRETQR